MPRDLHFAALFLTTALTACGGGAIELVGTYSSNFGSDETITEEKWGDATLEDWDNGANWAVTRNPDDAEYFPGKYAKVVWTEPAGGSFYYCTVAYGLDTLEAAATSTQAADATNPDTSGCSGFSWTKLSVK
jgi:hypothetical protein